jgi:hypothetical protein
MGVTASQPGEPDTLEQLGDLRLPPLPCPKPKPDVALHREMREEAPLLGDVADPATLGADVVMVIVENHATDRHHPPVGPLEAGEDAQQGRLATAGGPEHRREGAVRNGEIDAAEDGVISEGLVKVGGRQALGGTGLGGHEAVPARPGRRSK